MKKWTAEQKSLFEVVKIPQEKISPGRKWADLAPGTSTDAPRVPVGCGKIWMSSRISNFALEPRESLHSLCSSLLNSITAFVKCIAECLRTAADLSGFAASFPTPPSFAGSNYGIVYYSRPTSPPLFFFLFSSFFFVVFYFVLERKAVCLLRVRIDSGN